MAVPNPIASLGSVSRRIKWCFLRVMTSKAVPASVCLVPLVFLARLSSLYSAKRRNVAVRQDLMLFVVTRSTDLGKI